MAKLKDIATEAGVSISTVSKALHNSTDINEETQKHILDIAQKKGYKQKNTYKSLSQKHAIAIIYSDITSHYYTMLLKEFGIQLAKKGTIMVMSSAFFELQNIIELCNYYKNSRSVDGIIIISPFNVIGKIPSFNIPMVGISYPSSEYHEFDYICVDDEIGIFEAIYKLKKLGHRDFAYLGDKYTWYRRDYFKKAMKSLNLTIDPKFIIESNLRFEKAGQDAMTHLLQRQELPTAIFCAYDDIALGAYQVISDKNLRVPEDFSLAGVDGTQTQITANKKIASVNCHIKDQVDVALNILFRKINNESLSGTVQNINLRTQFVATNTIGPPRKNKLIY